jgi:DNA-binding LacI/PurR family transcriptional regulator
MAYMPEPFTVVRQQTYAIGCEATRLLLERITAVTAEPPPAASPQRALLIAPTLRRHEPASATPEEESLLGAP